MNLSSLVAVSIAVSLFGYKNRAFHDPNVTLFFRQANRKARMIAPLRKTVFDRVLQERILVLDGAMGTMIQSYQLGEAEYRGTRFADWPRDLKGNNDLLCLTRPQVIEEIHKAYLDAGADIIQTNTFNANRISLADYGMEDLAFELNREAAALARRVADTVQTADRPRFVAGSIGPTNRTASISPDVSNPSARNVTFDQLVDAYYEAVDGDRKSVV